MNKIQECGQFQVNGQTYYFWIYEPNTEYIHPPDGIAIEILATDTAEQVKEKLNEAIEINEGDNCRL